MNLRTLFCVAIEIIKRHLVFAVEVSWPREQNSVTDFASANVHFHSCHYYGMAADRKVERTSLLCVPSHLLEFIGFHSRQVSLRMHVSICRSRFLSYFVFPQLNYTYLPIETGNWMCCRYIFPLHIVVGPLPSLVSTIMCCACLFSVSTKMKIVSFYLS